MHTKEPWRVASVEPAAYGSRDIYQRGPKRAHVAQVWNGGSASQEIADANARRIVACVNACAGIPTEALEAGIYKPVKVLWGSALLGSD